jgi:uncharacterized membrane protein
VSRLRAAARATDRGDDGTVLLLVLSFTTIVLALVLGVTDVSALLLARRGLQSVADGAALAVAQDVSVAGLYGPSHRLTFADQPTLQADAERYVARSDLPDAAAAAAPNGDVVQVVLRRSVRLPFGALLDLLGIGGTQELTASAHAQLRCLGC